METSHTPGPWSRNDGLTISDNHNVKIADVSYASHPQECEANAQLIEAAPDLLDALREMVIANHGLPANAQEEPDPVRGAALVKALLAIGKAQKSLLTQSATPVSLQNT